MLLFVENLFQPIGHFRVPPAALYQNEVKCSAFDMEMVFQSHVDKTHFHKEGCALGLILKVRVFGTRNWPVRSTTRTTVVTHHQYVISVLLGHHFTGIPFVASQNVCYFHTEK